MALSLMSGNEAIARAALQAGCRFFAGYPITPATTIYHHMLELLPPAGGICIQGEDEIASLGFCIGASMAGMKVMTATSGPGISLYSEQIGFAIGGEVPMVVVDVQRLGPSTGSATRGADGDIQFLRWSSSGGMPVIVLAPVDLYDCFEMVGQAFNLAEQYRCVVFIALNKEIGMTRESVDLDLIKQPDIFERQLCPSEGPFMPFAVAPGEQVPCFLPMGGDRTVRQTSSTHGPDGYITTQPDVIAANTNRLKHKLDDAVNNFSFYELDGSDDAGTLIITYGVTTRAARAAMAMLKDQGKQAALLVLKTLWPVPEKVIIAHLDGVAEVVVVEMNLGQYVREIERLLPHKRLTFIGQMDGELISPATIVEAVMA